MRKQPLENETTLTLHMHGSAHNPEQYQFLSLYIFNPLYTTDFLTGCTALCYHHPLCQKITHRKQPSLTGPPTHTSHQLQVNKQWLPCFCVYSRQTAAAVGSLTPDSLRAGGEFTQKQHKVFFTLYTRF